MALVALGIDNLRCLEAVEVEPAPGVNVIFGENASGKTSLLEAIFVLGRGRSFRGSRADELVRDGQDEAVVRGRVGSDNRTVPAGVRVTRSGTEMRVGGAPAGVADLAELLAVDLIGPDVHRLVEDGPGERRRFVDRGLFHVKHGFLGSWREYQRILRHRNTLLKAGSRGRELETWSRQLAEKGESLSAFRSAYVEELSQILAENRADLLDAAVGLEHRRGWPSGKDLAAALAESQERDLRFGMTHVGPHRDEVHVRLEDRKARWRVSRGQQKLVAASLVLAQVRHLETVAGTRSVLLVDDAPAELDERHLGRLLAAVEASGAQVFVTTLDREAVAACRSERVFHVKQGAVERV